MKRLKRAFDYVHVCKSQNVPIRNVVSISICTTYFDKFIRHATFLANTSPIISALDILVVSRSKCFCG